MNKDKVNEQNDLQKAAEQWVHLLMMHLRGQRIKQSLAVKNSQTDSKK